MIGRELQEKVVDRQAFVIGQPKAQLSESTADIAIDPHRTRLGFLGGKDGIRVDSPNEGRRTQYAAAALKQRHRDVLSASDRDTWAVPGARDIGRVARTTVKPKPAQIATEMVEPQRQRNGQHAGSSSKR